LEFEPQVPGEGVTLHDIADLFGHLNGALLELSIVVTSRRGFVNSQAPAEVIYLRMKSPLRILLKAKGIPKEVFHAFAHFVRTIMFYREERSRREAVAAMAWKDVCAKRLQNIKTAMGRRRDDG
jgi:hypothetical protein